MIPSELEVRLLPLAYLSVTSAYWLPSHFLSCIPPGASSFAQTSTKHVPQAIMAKEWEPHHLPGAYPQQTSFAYLDVPLSLHPLPTGTFLKNF